MDVRLILLLLHFVLLVEITTFQSDIDQSVIKLNAKRLEYNESRFYELNCSSSKQSIGNAAEFIIDGKSVEYIAFHDNKCYDGKFEECTLDYCQCFPKENGYIHKYKDRNKHVASIFGCKMRFSGHVTGDIIKAVISVKINGTEIQIHNYTVDKLKQQKEKNTDEEKKTSFGGTITIWMPIMFILLIIFIACCLIVVVRCKNRRHKKDRIGKTIEHTEKKDSSEMVEMLRKEVKYLEHEDRKSKIYGHTTNKKESYEIVEMLPAEETNIGKKF